jgi:hypothetical protein
MDWQNFMLCFRAKNALFRGWADCAPCVGAAFGGGWLFLPGALLMAVGAQLFAPLMFVDLAFTAFF